jgi:hypothetical protein
MAISVVNGYLCMNGCDAAKARTGQNPHPASNSASGGNGPASSGGDQSAVVYGGALSGLNGSAASLLPTTASKPVVNILA